MHSRNVCMGMHHSAAICGWTSPPILQKHRFTANELACLAVLVVAIIATLYSIYLVAIVYGAFPLVSELRKLKC